MAPGTVWTAQEDEELRQLVREHGEKKWTFISSVMGSRKSSKQCRRRWLNHLNMKTKKCGWAPEEDQLLLSYHEKMGNKWTEIARMIGGRTDNAVKNRYHALVRRDGRVGTSSDDSSGHSCHGDQRRLHGSQPDDTRSMDMWKSSLEKLRSLMRRGKPKTLEDAVARAIKAVDDDSDTNDMDTDPNTCFEPLRMGGLPQQQWPPAVSTLVTENPEIQSSSDSYGTEDNNELRTLGHQIGLIDMQDSSSAELKAELMDIESPYNSMDDRYGNPQSENSSKSSSSDGFAYSFGFSSGYSHEHLQEGTQDWLMRGNHTSPGYYTWVSPSGDAHVSEFFPCASASVMCHQVDHLLMQ